MDTVSFTRMKDGTREDYVLIEQFEAKHAEGLVDRLLGQLRALADEPLPLKVDRLEHSLQTATRAHRDGADEELVVAALLHDIGDELAPYNHCELAAAILRPYVSERTYWVVKHHGVFQSHYYAAHFGDDPEARDRYRDSPHYDACVEFCERWDQESFDPSYESLPLAFFEPMVRRIFARRPFMHDRANIGTVGRDA
ncbi:MAG: HD domain-containing protein [Gemmatimonadales bacterium]